MLIKTRGKFANIRHTPFKDIEPAGTKKDQIQDRKIANVKKSVKKIQSRIELRFTDQFQNAAVTSTATFLSLNQLTVGDLPTSRTGNQISATSIQWRGRISNSAAATTSNVVRMIIGWDAQCNAANPTAALLLENGIVTPLVSAPYNHNNSKRFRILYDKRFNVGAKNATQTIDNVLVGGKIKLSRPIKFNDVGGGTVADVTTNNLFAMFVSNDATNSPVVAIGFRLYFKDA